MAQKSEKYLPYTGIYRIRRYILQGSTDCPKLVHKSTRKGIYLTLKQVSPYRPREIWHVDIGNDQCACARREMVDIRPHRFEKFARWNCVEADIIDIYTSYWKHRQTYNIGKNYMHGCDDEICLRNIRLKLKYMHENKSKWFQHKCVNYNKYWTSIDQLLVWNKIPTISMTFMLDF